MTALEVQGVAAEDGGHHRVRAPALRTHGGPSIPPGAIEKGAHAARSSDDACGALRQYTATVHKEKALAPPLVDLFHFYFCSYHRGVVWRVFQGLQPPAGLEISPSCPTRNSCFVHSFQRTSERWLHIQGRCVQVARIVLDPVVVNIQASWVKMGSQWAARLLSAGANDMGGSIMNESITRCAPLSARMSGVVWLLHAHLNLGRWLLHNE